MTLENERSSFKGALMNFQEERLAFFAELGQAVAKWGELEMSLTWLAVECFVPEDKIPAIIGYRSIDSLRARLKYIDTLLYNKGLPDRDRAAWTALIDATKNLSRCRNKLVHYWFYEDQKMRSGRRVMLLPVQVQPKDQFHDYVGAVCVRDIAGYRQQFDALHGDLYNLYNRISGRRWRLPGRRQLSKNPPTLAQILAKIRAAVLPE